MSHAISCRLTSPKPPTRDAFVQKHGDMAVELDALPADVLTVRLVETVEAIMDLERFAEIRQLENEERRQLADALRGLT
jgi:hypothetical protein